MHVDPASWLPICASPLTDSLAIGNLRTVLAAGRLQMKTVEEPFAMASGGPTQATISVTRAAGSPPINTVGAPGAEMGPPTCGTNPETIGQVCMSVNLAAGSPTYSSSETCQNQS